MTKQLNRLNIKPTYSLVPLPKSGHRYINIPPRKKTSYMVYLHKDKYNSRTFKNLNDALCYKFIVILKYKAKIGY
mgnify:CR=1 FL=1